jgi:hypothetical protein
MGFDLTIQLNVGLDPETGMAYIWDSKQPLRKPFIPSEYTVPEDFRKYLIQRGSCFRSYIKKYSE